MTNDADTADLFGARIHEAASTVHGYEIVGMLGRGGMGTVYQARQPRVNRYVALKELAFGVRGDDRSAERFLREAQIGASLTHESIVRLYDYFEFAGTAYIVMELVEGGPLSPLIRQLTLPQSLGVLEALLAALDHAAGKGIVHRDLKPANLLITSDGKIKVADFGIAKAYDTAVGEGLTARGLTVGTPPYMAPEQALGDPVDPRADLYVAGLLAFEMFTGRLPFDERLDWRAVVQKCIYDRPPRPHEVNPDLPAGFGEWVESLLASKPDDRPVDAATAWAELEALAVRRFDWRWRQDAALPVPSPVVTKLARAPNRRAERPPVSRRRRGWMLALAAAVASAGLALAQPWEVDDPGVPVVTATPTQTPSLTPTPTETPHPDDNKLLAMLPARLRDSCTPVTEGDDYARVECDRWGANLYFELRKDALDAREPVRWAADDAKRGARGRAERCRDADFRLPYVGWIKPSGTSHRGMLVCTYDIEPVADDGTATWEWSVPGRPIAATMFVFGARATAATRAYSAWKQAIQGW